MDQAAEPSVKGGLDGGTIYLTTADRWGNMVWLIHSVFSVYGSGATVAPYGFILHNRGVAFSLNPHGHAWRGNPVAILSRFCFRLR